MPDPSQPHLNHCAIFARNLDRSVEFYKNAFGLEVGVRWKEPGLATGGTEQRVELPGVHLEDGAGRRIDVFESAGPTGDRDDSRPINHFAFEVGEVRAAVQRIGICYY